MAVQKVSKADINAGYVKSAVSGPFMCSVDLAFNEERGDWDVILRKYPLLSNTCETVIAYFHTLKDAKACVERNKKSWVSQGIAFFDENCKFHSSGNKFYENAYKGAFQEED